ncbi:hypothetical protein [Salibacterium sp. K-3]
MKSLKVDRTGDLVMENGDLVEVSGKDEVVQNFRDLLKINKNEWFLDPSQGFDFRVKRGKNVDEEEVRDAIEDVVDQADGVDSVENIQMDDTERKDRHMTLRFTVVLENGDTEDMEEVL